MSDFFKLDDKLAALLAELRSLGSCVVALSGGVDSAVLAAAAKRAFAADAQAKVLTVSAASESLSSFERASITANVSELGLPHRFVRTDEMSAAGYRANNGNRCYFCKHELYQTLLALAATDGYSHVLTGVNEDDLGDHRPGIVAAGELGVRTPLADCQIRKAEVRELARRWNLTVWDRPSNPCLSSRVAYGLEVSPARLAMIEAAEAVVRAAGFSDLRVRLHAGDLARVEVPATELPLLLDLETREALNTKLTEIGFKFVAFDLAGLRSGSLNALIPLEQIQTNEPPRPTGG